MIKNKANNVPRWILMILITLSVLPWGTPGFGRQSPRVKPGLDNFLENHWKRFRGLRLGLLTNQTGVTSRGTHAIQALEKLPGISLTVIFTPEHGLFGDEPAGQKVSDQKDAQGSGGPVVRSLYGSHRKPPLEWLKDIDVLLYDIQDVTCRTYTYISTLSYVMDACAEAGKRVLVLDRPTAIRGDLVEGPVMEEEFTSFIGLHPIPLIYGMTPGELAMYMNSEYMKGVSLEVIPLRGYTHEMDYGDTGLDWVPPSPHIPTFETAYFYAALGPLGEGGRISEGVGFPLPFRMVGLPGLNPLEVAEGLSDCKLPGVRFIAYTFKPFYGLFKEKRCSGALICLEDRKLFSPWRTCLALAQVIHSLTDGKAPFGPEGSSSARDRTLLAMGTRRVSQSLFRGDTVESILKQDRKGIDEFMKKRRKYLLYPEK